MRQRVLDTLPSALKETTVQQCLLHVEGLEKTKLYEFVGVGCQKVVGEVVNIIKGLHGKRAPEWPVTNTEFMASVRERVGTFCRSQEAGADGVAPTVLVGKAAMKNMFKDAKAKKDESQRLTFDELAPFRLYSWLLDPVELETADEWLADTAGGVSSSAVTTTARSRGAAAKKEKLAKEKEKATKKKVSALFS